MFVRRTLVLALVAALAAGSAAAGDDAPPPAPKTEGKVPPPAKDGAKGDADEGAAPAATDPKPAMTVEQILAGLADAKFAVKRLDAAAAAKEVQDPKLVAPLSKLLRDEHPDVRAAAIAALGARSDEGDRKKAADALCDRLKAAADKPELDHERIAIAGALHDLAQVASVDPLLDGVGNATTLDEADARCRAVANVPSPKAIEGLIALMSKRHRDGSGVRAACVKALQYATGERGGNDADAWRAWWKDHEKTFDFAAAASRRRQEAEAKKPKRNRPRK